MGLIRLVVGRAIRKVLSDKQLRDEAINIARKGAKKAIKIKQEGNVAKNLGKSFSKLKKSFKK